MTDDKLGLAARWALPAAYQWWLYSDAAFSSGLRGRPETLNAVWVQEIARRYGIARNLGGDRYEALAEMVRELDDPGAASLVDRAAAIRGLMAHWRGRAVYSAVSKVSWFVWPEGWTMFDSYAARAISARGTTTREVFDDFYHRLDRACFKRRASGIRDELPAIVSPLLAERALDIFLVLAGSPDLERRAQMLPAFLSSLPATAGTVVGNAANEIAPLLLEFAKEASSA